MKWLPALEDFRTRLLCAGTLADDLKLAELAALAASRLSYLEIARLDHEISKLAARSYPGVERLRLGIVASSSVRHLLPAIRVAGLRHGLLVEIHVAGFDQLNQEVLDQHSGLNQFRPHAVLLAPVARHLIESALLNGMGPRDHSALVNGEIAGARQLWTSLQRNMGASVVHQSYLDIGDAIFGNLDAGLPATSRALIACLNQTLAAEARAQGVLWLDIERAAGRFGLDAWHNPSLWTQAKIETSYEAAPLYGELLARLLAAARGKSKKCLVLDLDNTLWGGVLGDDGPNAIQLGQGSAIGEAHLALQRYARALSARGVLLALCSKNDPDLVEGVLASHPEMLLRRADFAAIAVNWRDKADNLAAIAADLNIGLDSLVFVDDNPAERARVRQALPMVATPELPADPSLFVRALSEAGYFEAIAVTAEDLSRNQYVAADALRLQTRAFAQTLEDFLDTLDMRIAAGPVLPPTLKRVAQLINKTNQFNTTTIRRSEANLAELAADTQGLCLQFRLADRFGDNGIISALVLTPSADEIGALDIVNWVMSCRVFGRGVEFEVMNILVDSLIEKGVPVLRAHFIPSARNGVIAQLFGELGFSRVKTGPEIEIWRLVVNTYRHHPTQIKREPSP